MKILITGSAGQLGCDLVRVLNADHELFPLSRNELDVTDNRKVIETAERIRPDVIIHTAAQTNVDLAESQVELTYRVNALGARNVAVAAQKTGAKLVHLSTGYVFDGTKKEPYHEFDPPSPIGVYGASKLVGEQYVAMFCDRFFIVRASWLYGLHGNNFVTKILSRVRREKNITVVDDKYGSPTYSLDLAHFIRHLLTTEKYGIYHAANEGGCSRYEFAAAIVEAANLTDVRLTAVGSDQFPLPAARPDNSVFASAAIRLNDLPPLRDWREALREFIRSDLRLS
jgi:dTDP-4-dehydrorhamnose reductase